MYPIAICKVFEEFKHNTFEERLECFKLIHTWLNKSPNNFPLIFCQGIASMAKADDLFKKGCIEFLRQLAIKKPNFCSTVGGFRLLITNLLDENSLDISDNIIFTLLYIMNTPSKRKYFNGFADFYKIFAIFTKSDFTLKDKDKPDENSNEERNKLDVQLELSKRIIEKLLKTWPGYSLIMGDYTAMGSIIESLNTDTSLSIKKSVLDMVKNIIENDYIIVDNFTNLSSKTKDEFYVNKIYLAYILQGLQNNKLYESLIKFIEKDNNPLIDYAHKIALKFTILYSKLSNTDLQLPFLNKKIEKQKHNEMQLTMGNNNNNAMNGVNNISALQNHNINQNQLLQQQQQPKNSLEDEFINTKVKIMHLLDQTFYHFNCKDFVNFEISDLSNEIIIAMNSIVNTQNIKKYNNQYSIESSKKELYTINNDSFQQILKNSKILDVKEFKNWEWKYIDEILDIVETRKDLIMDLYRQKFFKRLLLCFMPSKNQFTKLPWMTEQFIYASIGSKFFKLLSQSQEGITILDTSPEEYLFQKSNTWYEDVQQCLENLLNKTDLKEQPFTIRRMYRTMSKHIFNFLGVLSQTAQGEDYLELKGFYNLIHKFAGDSNYDYIILNLIDNLNFNSRNVMTFVKEILNKGSTLTKRYVFEHIKCLLKFGKDIVCNVKFLLDSLIEGNIEVNQVIIGILISLIQEGKHIDELITSDKKNELFGFLSYKNKEPLYLMMRNKEAYAAMDMFIEEEIKNINMKEIVSEYAIQLEENMNEIFNYEDSRADNYYLNIHLPKIENQYENYTELFWLKQLPFGVNIIISENNNAHKNEQFLLNTCLEYHDEKKIIIYAKPQDMKTINLNINENQIQFFCMLGEHYIDTKCKILTYNHSLTFDKKEYDKHKIVKQNGIQYHKIEKEGISILLQPSKDNDKIFSLYSVSFNVRIRPEKKQSLKTPVNILTELANNETGTQTLIDLKAIEFLFSYLDNTSVSSKEIKSALWILAKIVTKEIYGEMLENKYKIINKISSYNKHCEDYAMKGTICYVMCYISQNKNLKHSIEDSYDFFFNTDICIPKNLKDIYINSKTTYENKKLKEDGEKINKHITLSDKSNQIFSNVTSLINNISYKQAYEKLNEMIKSDAKAFNDPNLLIKIYAMLSRYKCRQNLRRFIMILFENAIASPDIIDVAVKKMEGIGKNLFECVEGNEEGEEEKKRE